MKYQKKPVIIEARRVDALDYDEVCDIIRWCHGHAVGEDDAGPEGAMIAIDTLEGTMHAMDGDYIIQGVKGEFYPCKPDVFAATYAPANPPDDLHGKATAITTHADSLGLNDILVLVRDDRDPKAGNASHHYIGFLPADFGEGRVVLDIQFQHGARTNPDSVPGCLEGAVLTVLIDRLEGMQEGPFACVENDIAIAQLRLARAIITDRAARRKAQQVLGKDAAHKS